VTDNLKESRLKKLILASMLTALAVGIGYLFLSIPNVEMITAAVFIAGYIMGPAFGLLIGVLTEFLFSLFNPYGAPALPLLLAQIIAFGFTGLVGGWFQKLWARKKNGIRISLYAAGCGLLVTLVYDVLTTLSLVFVLADLDYRGMAALFTGGMIFYLTHAAVNTLIFAVIVPIIMYRLQPHIPEYLYK